jgi:hypothetical protein
MKRRNKRKSISSPAERMRSREALRRIRRDFDLIKTKFEAKWIINRLGAQIELLEKDKSLIDSTGEPLDYALSTLSRDSRNRFHGKISAAFSHLLTVSPFHEESAGQSAEFNHLDSWLNIAWIQFLIVSAFVWKLLTVVRLFNQSITKRSSRLFAPSRLDHIIALSGAEPKRLCRVIHETFIPNNAPRASNISLIVAFLRR